MSSTTIPLSTRPTSTTKPIAIPSSKSHSQAQTKLRSVPSLDSGYFENNSPPPSPPPTAEERLSVPMLADEAIRLLRKQDAKMMSLGDFIAELREDYDLRTVVVDEVLEFMTANGWVQLWKRKGKEETWISIA
ncbi:hypothetical protein, variant 2 [Cryptococcus amylolentus CBS 6039]|uniref:Uncharacterized protein n=1 Tax=Cryptococcus amylolentus CBS 6039 TaxID=1295533 RepID=A0A1E3I5S8_9TREE|nr:hypothetical protein L202_00079 [Cryptococcus amylolentus CBS 6039]XP_018997857.1 hypothetical protein, variant 1 [Cryptococcus amylolentus CBS 6039]XP_018997858.1 hypothetical protein, variant 2 [Cryptococcus amylolentus CBS 6039]ODN84053.1 hypothetical protein L202_00079 [Cryptococcus amylolentus CBS 6039]ODN84054.1 hypothetical protein, variant 1 [Cryptococcus amylolentus CBS 6039]ODN84055.1 hypothetical protein, variant 2 [Cryptococcus amylolentus CBS 6039]